MTVKHDGRPYEVRIPDLEIPTCRNCGEQVFTGGEDDRITAALRKQIDLLMPAEIQRRRKERELSQEKLAEQLGVAKETISRWESGAVIQSRAMDNLLRLFFESNEARDLLARKFKLYQDCPMNTAWKTKPATPIDYRRLGREVLSRRQSKRRAPVRRPAAR
jgi:putative zinc finger/helix-turn-helix YgiT family protein